MTGRRDPDIGAVMSLERALLRSEIRASADSLDDLLDPDFREIGASGRLWTRPEIIAALTSRVVPDDVQEIKDEDMDGTLLSPDLVLLSYVSDAGGRRARRTSLWKRHGASWQLLHHQGTLLS